MFKRGMKGVYQHCAEQHLHRYLAEFDFRYNNRIPMGVDDTARADSRCKALLASGSPIERLDTQRRSHGKSPKRKARKANSEPKPKLTDADRHRRFADMAHKVDGFRRYGGLQPRFRCTVKADCEANATDKHRSISFINYDPFSFRPIAKISIKSFSVIHALFCVVFVVTSSPVRNMVTPNVCEITEFHSRPLRAIKNCFFLRC